jgi:uncharacterized protein (TIGR01777 family)
MRVVHLRFGLVLTRKGGALAKMLPPFRLGIGGRIGSGQQFWSWITLDDTVGAVLHALNTPAVQGAVNVVSPQPVRNAEFAQALGHALNRPALLPVPAFAIRLAAGREMADELFLSSARVEPMKLQQTRYSFQHPELAGALQHVLS